MCPTECVGDISGEAASSVQINKGISRPRAAVARLAAMVVADIKKGAAKTERGGERRRTADRVREREREQTGRAQKDIVRPRGKRALRDGLCKQAQEFAPADGPCRRVSHVRKTPTSRMPSVPADGLSGIDSVCFKEVLTSRMPSAPADGLSRRVSHA